MPKVSIIVPIYNIEKYLRECLDSLVSQTLKEIEIICVNDGSTDSSSKIINEYASKDNRIKVIDKANSGYGDSVNRGIELAQGEYIGIIESDDIAGIEMFYDLYAIAKEKELEVVRSLFYYYYPEKNKKTVLQIDKNILNRVIEPLKEFETFFIQPNIWSSIYKTSFLRKNNIKFNPTPGASYQDTSFNFIILSMAKNIFIKNKAYVLYRQHEDSSVNNANKVFCIYDEHKYITNYIEKESSCTQEKRKLLYELKNKIKFTGYLWNYIRLEGENKQKFLTLFKEELKTDIKNNHINKDLYKKEELAVLEMLLGKENLNNVKSKYRFYSIADSLTLGLNKYIKDKKRSYRRLIR